MPRTLIVIPTYNETQNVERLWAGLRSAALDADILFVDDGSPDGTGDILDALAGQDPRVSVIHRAGKLGIGSAHRAGIAHAYASGYDLLITMDADFSHQPADIPRLLAAHQVDVDLVVASRFLRRDSLPGWSLHRWFLTQLGHILTRALLGLPHDATGALRLYDLRRVPREVFDRARAPAYAFFFESLFILHRTGARIREIPIVLPARVYGSSKLNAREAARSARHLLRLFRLRLTGPAWLRSSRQVDRLRPELPQTHEWDDYWTEKRHPLRGVYDVAARAYRRLVRRHLARYVRRWFPEGARLLHAGCGGGQVDHGLHARFRITAVDISEPALRLYARNNPHASRIEQASIFHLPFEDGVFDGIYNLGVLEHFEPHAIRDILAQFRRVLTPGGKLVVFWPHRKGTSVLLLGMLRRVIRLISSRDIKLHPDEVSLLASRNDAEHILRDAGFVLRDYYFGPKDGFIQCIVVGETRDDRPRVTTSQSPIDGSGGMA